MTLFVVQAGVNPNIHEIVKFNYYEFVKKIAALITSEELKLKITNDLLLMVNSHLRGPYVNYLARLANLFSVITNRFRDVLADRYYEIFNNVYQIFQSTCDNISVLKEIIQIFESLARICVVCVKKIENQEERNLQFNNIFNTTLKSKILDVIQSKVQN